MITDQCSAFNIKLAVGIEVGFFSLDKYCTSRLYILKSRTELPDFKKTNEATEDI